LDFKGKSTCTSTKEALGLVLCVDDLGGIFQEERKGLDLPSAFGRCDGWRLPEAVKTKEIKCANERG